MLLSVNNIEVKYSGVIMALKGVSLSIKEGSVVSLFGANGAGKTTVIRAISGMLNSQLGKVTEGTIEFKGVMVENADPELISRLGVSQVMEGRRILEHLSVEENIRIGYNKRRERTFSLRDELDKVYSFFPKLRDLRNKTSGYISGGEQQMMVVGRALITHPSLLLIDEMSLGLAPLIIDEIADILRNINETEGISILLVEQNAMIALALSEYGYVMESGRIVLDGPSQELQENQDIQEFYLGISKVGTKKGYKNLKHYSRRKRWLG